MLTILVSRFKQEITTVDGSVMPVQAVFVPHGEDDFRLLRTRDTFSGIGSIEIVLMRWHRLWRLKTPERLQRGVVECLERYHAMQDLSFDCYGFVNLVCGVKPHRPIDGHQFWETKPLYRWSRPTVGEVVFLVNEAHDFFYHAAIYIGFGLYISVYGAGGDLEVASLSDMKKGYGAKYTLRARPRTHMPN